MRKREAIINVINKYNLPEKENKRKKILSRVRERSVEMKVLFLIECARLSSLKCDREAKN